MQAFVEPYTVPASTSTEEAVVDLDNPKPGPGAQLPCVAAMEFLADIYEKAGGDQTGKAIEVSSRGTPRRFEQANRPPQ